MPPTLGGDDLPTPAGHPYSSGPAVVYRGKVVPQIRLGTRLAYTRTLDVVTSQTVPGPPSIQSAQPLPPNAVQSVTIRWSAPEYTGGATISSYAVYMGADNIQSETPLAQNGVAMDVPVEIGGGTFQANVYNYPGYSGTEGAGALVVRALNAVGVGLPSAQRPSLPRNLVIANVGTETSYIVEWDAPEFDYGFPILEYLIAIGGDIVASVPANARSLLLDITEENEGDWYGNTLEVLALNEGGLSDGIALPLIEYDMRPAVPPGPPTIASAITYEGDTFSTITVSPPLGTGGAAVVDYRAYINNAPAPAAVDLEAGQLVVTASDGDLVQVSAYTAVGEGARSAAVAIALGGQGV